MVLDSLGGFRYPVFFFQSSFHPLDVLYQKVFSRKFVIISKMVHPLMVFEMYMVESILDPCLVWPMKIPIALSVGLFPSLLTKNIVYGVMEASSKSYWPTEKRKEIWRMFSECSGISNLIFFLFEKYSIGSLFFFFGPPYSGRFDFTLPPRICGGNSFGFCMFFLFCFVLFCFLTL